MKLRSGFRTTQVDAEINVKTNDNGTIEMTVTDRSEYA
jgi:hypothetical protein